MKNFICLFLLITTGCVTSTHADDCVQKNQARVFLECVKSANKNGGGASNWAISQCKVAANSYFFCDENNKN